VLLIKESADDISMDSVYLVAQRPAAVLPPEVLQRPCTDAVKLCGCSACAGVHLSEFRLWPKIGGPRPMRNDGNVNEVRL
jgi:hypothetical protein